jgi:hypothetical protein
MGAFTTGDNGPAVNQPDEPDQDERGVPTDVENLYANDKVAHGGAEYPCFDVEPESFYQNMENGRKRLRFKPGSPVQQYMAKTKYRIPFFIRTTDTNGKSYTRKVK